MEDAYYAIVRNEIAPLLPATAHRVLEVGCGAGGTLLWLRGRWPDAWLAGVDLNAGQLARASGIDYAECCDLEIGLPAVEESSIDLLLCLDVLEHLHDPWSAVKRLGRLVAPGGRIIASLPNVRHATVLWPLLVRGDWEYGSSGILDRTHLRFFTRKSAIGLIEAGGFVVDAVEGIGTQPGRRGRKFHIATLGLMRDFLTRQYLVRGVRGDPGPRSRSAT